MHSFPSSFNEGNQIPCSQMPLRVQGSILQELHYQVIPVSISLEKDELTAQSLALLPSLHIKRLAIPMEC